MNELFPEWLEVPPGLVKRRLFFGMPPGMFMFLAILCFGPLWFLGWKTLLVWPVVLPVGMYLALQCKDDPEFLTTWLGDLRLLQRYH